VILQFGHCFCGESKEAGMNRDMTATSSKKCLRMSEMRLAFGFLVMNENHQNPKDGIVRQ